MADTFFGGTLAFSTSSFTVDILEISRSGVSVADIETSHASTSGGYKTYMPADLIEGGTYEVTIAHDPDDDVEGQIKVVQTITHTYPLPSGQSTAADKEFSGYINSYDEALPVDDQMTATITIKVAGAVTTTASA